MLRREFGLAGMSAVALAAMQTTGVAEEHKSGGHDGMMSKCSEACSDCQRECAGCAHHCATLLADGKKQHMTTLQHCQDCADVCTAAAQIVARHGEMSSLICSACADACAKCAKECEKFADDKMMAACAKECRDCEKACREMMRHV